METYGKQFGLFTNKTEAFTTQYFVLPISFTEYKQKTSPTCTKMFVFIINYILGEDVRWSLNGFRMYVCNMQLLHAKASLMNVLIINFVWEKIIFVKSYLYFSSLIFIQYECLCHRPLMVHLHQTNGNWMFGSCDWCKVFLIVKTPFVFVHFNCFNNF